MRRQRGWMAVGLLVLSGCGAAKAAAPATTAPSAGAFTSSGTPSTSTDPTTPDPPASPPAASTAAPSHTAPWAASAIHPADTATSPGGTTSVVKAALATLPVKGQATRTGYSSAEFGQARSDDV